MPNPFRFDLSARPVWIHWFVPRFVKIEHLSCLVKSILGSVQKCHRLWNQNLSELQRSGSTEIHSVKSNRCFFAKFIVQVIINNSGVVM